jgi:hypothetical protein
LFMGFHLVASCVKTWLMGAQMWRLGVWGAAMLRPYKS